MTNSEVKRRFLEGKPGTASSLVSTGQSLLSYGWWEVARWVDGKVIVRNGRSYSMTTASKHRSGVSGTLAQTETPIKQGPMNL